MDFLFVQFHSTIKHKKKTKNVIFFVSIVDSDNAEIMENYSAEQLNSYDKFLTFKNRFQSKP